MQRILTLLDTTFDHHIINDTDFIIKLKDNDSDNWMRVKFISTNIDCRIKEPFEDFLLVFYAKLLKKYFIIPRNEIPNINRINPGKKLSKYTKYNTPYNNITTTITDLMNNVKSYTFEIAKSSQLIIENVSQGSKIKFTFEHVYDLVKQKECEIVSKKEKYTNTKGPTPIKYKCGHEEDTTYNQFMRKCVYECRDCIFKNLSNNNYNDESRACVYAIKESEMFIKIKNELSKEFIVLKTNEACISDMIIKPLDDENDRWLPIQLKGSYNENCQYTFKMRSFYEDLVILCYAELDNRFWIFHGKDIKDIKSLTIGKTLSKYSDFEVKLENISEILLNCFNNQTLNSHDLMFNTEKHFMTPNSKNNLKEFIYKETRYEALKDLFTITYPTIDGTKTDCFINDLKVQDKLAYLDIRGSSNNLFKIHIINYIKGDNDIYWIHFEQEEYKDKCILLPESFLEKSSEEKELKTYLSTRLIESDPAHKYISDYTNFDLDKFNKLFSNK